MRDRKLIQLYLTNQCNSKCKTCPIWKNKEREELPLDIIMKLMLKEKDADYVLGGGEFFLYSRWRDLLAFCEQKNINYVILTNGLLPNLVHEAASSYAPNFTISWDGIKHDEIRGVPGNMEKIKQLIQYIRSCNAGIKLSYTFSKFNYDTIDADMEYAKNEFKMDKLYLALARDSDTFSGKDELVAPKDFHPLLKHLDMFEMRDRMFLMNWENTQNDIHCSMCKCNSLRDIITIYSNGDVPMCQGNMSNEKWGNIIYGDMDYIFDKMHQIRCDYNDVCYSLCQRRYDYKA